jgi:hypothetical protein
LNEEKQKRRLLMLVGNIGLLLLGLALARITFILDDIVTQGLVLFGLIFLGQYHRYTEKRAGVPDKEINISLVINVIVLLFLTFLFFF